MGILLDKSEYQKNGGGDHFIIIPNEIINSNEFSNLYYNNQEITGSVEFPNLTQINNDGLMFAFRDCIGLTSVEFPNLKSIEPYGLYYSFEGCTELTGNVEFPALQFVADRGLVNVFLNTNITEIHFRADAKSVIEAQETYYSKFGASNATIYFDL